MGTLKVRFFGYCFGEEPRSCCLQVPKALRGAINHTFSYFSPTHLCPFLVLALSCSSALFNAHLVLLLPTVLHVGVEKAEVRRATICFLGLITYRAALVSS